MKLTEFFRTKGKPTVSFEFFPARDEKAEASLAKVVDALAGAEPDFVSVTFGAGGSTREGSYALAAKLKREKKLEVLAYFAGYGMAPAEISGALDAYRDLGIDNVLVVRGDVPADGEGGPPHPEGFAHASELLGYVRPRYAFCLGAAGYPEGHKEAVSKEQDLAYLKLKVERGAEFIITQYFYDNRFYFDFVERCRGAGISVPIVAGVMPIFSVKMMENLAAMCGATITDEVRRGIAALPDGDKDALLAFGIDFSLKQCRELLGRGVPGLHIYTLDRSKSALEIVKRLKAEGLL